MGPYSSVPTEGYTPARNEGQPAERPAALPCPPAGVPSRPMPPDTAFTEAELADIEMWAKQDLTGNLGQQANARRTLRLVEEVRWFRTVIASIYHMVPDVPGTEKLQGRAGTANKLDNAELGVYIGPRHLWSLWASLTS